MDKVFGVVVGNIVGCVAQIAFGVPAMIAIPVSVVLMIIGLMFV